MGQYKYYFRKPKSEITKDILKGLAITGAVCLAATSPYFAINLMKGLKSRKRYNHKKVSSTFYNLKRDGCINIEIGKKNHQVFITLTERGRKKAGRFQIDDLAIKKPKKWDGKWRIVIFDIAQLQKLQRNAFREKLKALGFYPIQKSVLVCPYECKDEVGILREFFGLSQKEIRLITADNIEDDIFLKRIFKLSQ
jgi:DNA-binding transcriptional regulator PaaX